MPPLARNHGLMTVSVDGVEEGRMPLDDIGVLLCNARGLTYSNDLMTELARRGTAVVLCGDNYLPTAWLWPMEGHHIQALRMRRQLAASSHCASDCCDGRSSLRLTTGYLLAAHLSTSTVMGCPGAARTREILFPTGSTQFPSVFSGRMTSQHFLRSDCRRARNPDFEGRAQP